MSVVQITKEDQTEARRVASALVIAYMGETEKGLPPKLAALAAGIFVEAVLGSQMADAPQDARGQMYARELLAAAYHAGRLLGSELAAQTDAKLVVDAALKEAREAAPRRARTRGRKTT